MLRRGKKTEGVGVRVLANGTIWAAVAACVAFACSKEPPDLPVLEVAGGPKVPELSFHSDPEPAESAPIALTASDGTGLLLASVEVRSVIEDPLAFTELHLTFHNPENRRREGRFDIALPPEAAISRFAMRVADGWQEGEVVERKRAQQVYEDFLHRKQDPALLEKSAGNQFSARVFPIEANASKEIVIAYSEELREQRDPYRVRLKGLPRLGMLRVDVKLGSRTGQGDESKASARGAPGRLTLEKVDYVPEGDLEVRLPWRKPFALRHDNLVVARVSPVAGLPKADIDGLSVLFDTSASRALGFGAQIEHLDALIKALCTNAGKDFELRVLAFDQETEEIYRGPASRFGVRDHARLLARDALGASDLAQALAVLSRTSAGQSRVLVVGDGVITAGPAGTLELREAVAKLAAHGVRRLDALAEGGIQDRDTLTALTRAGLAHTGVVLDARMSATMLADKMLLGTRDRIEVRIAGAGFVYPSVLEGVQPGDERLVFAEIPKDMPVQIELAEAGATALPTLDVPRPLIERAIARARIEALTRELRALRPEAEAARVGIEQRIVMLSTQQRVVSDLTALLVLETEADYRRFGIEQNALSNILRVGEEGIELFDRRQRAPLEVAKGEWDDRDLAADGFGTRAPSDEEAPRGRVVSEGGGSVAGRGADLARPSRSESKARAASSAAREEPSAMAPRPSPAAPVTAAPRKLDVTTNRAAKPALPPSADTFPGTDTGVGSLGTSGSGAGAGAPTPRPTSDAVQIARPESETAPQRMVVRIHAQVRQAFGIPLATASLVARGLQARARSCFAEGSSAEGRSLSLVLDLSEKGQVRTVVVSASTLQDGKVRECIASATRRLAFPKPEGGTGRVELSLTFSEELQVIPVLSTPARPVAGRPRPRPALVRPALADAYTGDLGFVLEALQQNDISSALARATEARQRDPGDVLALIALGEALEAQHDVKRAARVYGSLIDLYPSRPDLRRMAGARLERLKDTGLALAIDSYRQAVAQRPDHPSGHRLLAYALVKASDYAGAFQVLERALDQPYPSGRFEGVDRILREDLALVAHAWLRAAPAAEPRIKAVLEERSLALDQKPSLRFVLTWETDANDVDFHIYDGRGGHAFYMQPKLSSGGSLYADVTTGFGPECFTVPGSARAYPYTLQAHYFSRGPMGYGMGKLQVVEHDGKGGLKFDEHPFVIMKDKAFIGLAELTGPLP